MNLEYKEKVFQRVAQLLKFDQPEAQINLILESKKKMYPHLSSLEVEDIFIQEVLMKTDDRTLDYLWYSYQKSMPTIKKQVA